MSEGQEITAEQCEWEADEYPAHSWIGGVVRRAARTIRRLEGEVAELRSRLAAWHAERSADAELGSLVRRIREHPEAKVPSLTFHAEERERAFDLDARDLKLALTFLDAVAATRRPTPERAP